MKQELNEDDLNQIDGGYVGICKILIAHAGHRCSYN
jgi:bacteriocin-like protein